MPRQRRQVPWLEPDHNGTYYIHWYDAERRRTQRKSVETKDPSEAQARFGAWLYDPALRDPTRLDGLTVSQILDDYWREHVAEKVIDKQRVENAIQHLKAFFGATAVRDIDIPLSRQYRDARRGHRREKGRGRQGASDSTIRRELVVLQAAAGHALKWKRIEANDMPSIEMPAEARAGEVPWLTQSELRLAISLAPSTRLKRFIRVCYYTAARRASIEQLTKAQIDLKNGRINLRSPNETALQRNSKKRRPVVPIHPEIRRDIEELLAETPNNWLWGDDADMYHRFAEHMADIGMKSKCFPHILRHSRATHLLQQGVNIWDVAKLLGDTVATVERVYGHHSADHLAETLRTA
jgi:integrase